MNEQQWQELIPFYVAQTLPPEQARAFEQYASAQGERCAREIDEWRRLAAAVWAEADSVAKQLPPLSQEVYNRLSYRDAQPTRYGTNPPRPDYAPPASKGQSRQGGVPITLVAGIVMALLFGALLLGIGLRPGEDNENSTQIAQNLTLEASQDAAASGIGLAEDTVTPSGTPIGGGILNTPFPTPTATNTLAPTTGVTAFPTSVPPATSTPLPAGTGGGQSAAGAEVAPLGGGPYITITPGLMQDGYHQCFLFNPTDQFINVHEYAGGSNIIGSIPPGAEYRVLIRSTSGWYQIFMPGANRAQAGWIAPENTYLTGNCDASLFWVPTATSTPTPNITRTPTDAAILPIGPGNVSIVEVPSTTLHTEPLATSDIVATVSQGDRLTPLAATFTNGTQWTQVRFGDVVGWIIAAQITTYAEEDAPPEATAQP